MEIFLEFCTSGYIGEDEILKIRARRGNYILPFHIVIRVLLRRNRRFYDGDHSFVKNLLQCDPKSYLPNHFIRLMALRWLEKRFKVEGPTKIPGYHRAGALVGDMVPLGFENGFVLVQLVYLLRSGCIVAEHFRTDHLSEDDLITLGPAGFVHLEMLDNVEYIAACAEDSWNSDRNVAIDISSRIANRHTQFFYSSTLRNAKAFLAYLSTREKDSFPCPDTFLVESMAVLRDLSEPNLRVMSEIQKRRSRDFWFDATERYPKGSTVVGTVVGKFRSGIRVQLDRRNASWIDAKRLREVGISEDEWPSTGQKVRVTVIDLDARTKDIKISLRNDWNVGTAPTRRVEPEDSSLDSNYTEEGPGSELEEPDSV